MMSAITQNSSLSLANGHTNGESFLLFGNNLHLTITGLQGRHDIHPRRNVILGRLTSRSQKPTMLL